MNQVTINKYTHEVKAGSWIILPSGRQEYVRDCDWAEGLADFALPTPLDTLVACNISLTGRTYQRKAGCNVVRCAITWKYDDAPSTTSSAWMEV